MVEGGVAAGVKVSIHIAWRSKRKTIPKSIENGEFVCLGVIF
jgi:hypothetical protein